jgi:hypothetical protein
MKRPAGLLKNSLWGCLWAVILGSSAAAWSEERAIDVDALIKSLARGAPARTDFTEVRFSSLLETPLILHGVLEYRAADSLSKRVDQPYVEELDISANEVRMRREKQPERRFSLGRAPELRSLLAGFSGLLSGDRARLAEFFVLSATGEHDGWRLSLAPRDSRTRSRLMDITVTGEAATPRCLIVENADGDASVMLLGAVAAKSLPDPLTLGGLRFHCRD